MDNEKSSLAKDLEDLVNKSMEVNKFFLNESSKFVRQFTTPGEKKTSTVFNANFLTEAFNAYTKLNIQYLKSAMDLGVSMVNKAGAQQASTDNATTEQATENLQAVPSFILKGEVEQGGKLSLNFLLDNIKPEAVICTLVNTTYKPEIDAAVEENFITTFTPQSFTLNTGAQQRVNIDINISANIKPGIYTSNVQVQGFEPAYFSMIITVKEIPIQTPANDRKSKKRSN
ncbi:MAG: hypothetical protein ABJB05_03200 [Parafilimonas sp.]